jgi:glycosyltransferase involved in cell wall biosynthesis
MRILIFEPDHGGHRLTFVRNMLRGFLELKQIEIIVATNRKAVESPEFNAQLAPLAQQIKIDTETEPSTGNPLSLARHKLRAFQETIGRLSPDHIFVPYADGLTQMLGLARCMGISAIPPGVESEGLLLRGGFAYTQSNRRGALQAQISRRLMGIAPWTITHFLDPIPFESVLRSSGKFAARSRLMPDPVEPPKTGDRFSARKQLGIPEHGRYVSCVGTLDGRKGIDLLIHAFASAKLAATDRLLLIGRLEARIRPLLENTYVDFVKKGRIILFDRYVSDDDLTAGVVAADVVCTPYPRHIGSASIVIRAASAHRPVLGSDFGWIASITERLKLGWTCRVTDREIFSSYLAKALEQADQYQLPEAGHRFVEFHTIANFNASWSARLRERLKLPPAPIQRTWQWVLDAI